jgi:AcrR family transcriptional regulator
VGITSLNRDTRERILNAGLEIVSERGFAGVSMGVLAERSGLSKSGLFAHFASKEDLQLQLLQVAEEALRRQVVEPAVKAEAGLPRLQELMRRWLGWAARAGLPGGCPLYAAAFEFDDQPGAVSEYLVASHRRWTEFLTAVIQDAVDLHQLRDDTDTAQVAWQLNGIYMAHHIGQRLLRDPDANRRAAVALDDLITSCSPNDPDVERSGK